MSEDEGTNASAQGVPSEDRPDDGDGVETDAGDESDAEPTDPEPETAGEESEADEETVEQLRAELEEAEAEIEDLESRLKRKQADFQNYKKRAKKRQEQMKDRATEDLVERLVGVRDNLKRALEEDSDDVESLREGVEMTMREFDRVLADEDVSEIDPEPGTETDPQRHEVMMQVDSDQPEGTVADVYTPGYEMGEKVIQNAQVTVSNGELEAAEDGDATE
ncbi:nucleotide exchange factor GrpE [Natronococcus roseus]|uniref:nucleotide exchange factor GrpE n=1 Tax=Natronococcus roseus TaxID=1052014 RepID=UPI00374D5204